MTLPTITKKQLEILLLVYNYRFIDRKQLQTILNHKNHRRIHSWLNDLVTKQCIVRIYSTKMPENTKPAVYYLGKYGRKLLAKHFTEMYRDDGEIKDTMLYQLKNTYKDSQRTEVFRTISLALVDCHIALTKYSQENDLSLSFYSPTKCAAYTLFEKFDGYIKVQKKRGKLKRYILLYFTNRTPRRFIRYRIPEIIKFLEHEWGYETDVPTPAILCVCSNLPIRNYVKKVWETKLEYYNYPELKINITTLHQFKEQALNTNIYIQPKNEEDY